MKRVFFVINLLFISVLCFSQQNIPSKIIGQIPNSNSTKLYQIQVGAFRISQNAENTYARLIREGFSPVYEKYFDYTRVIIKAVSAGQVQNYLTRIKRIGFDEILIREDTARRSISEKWEITTPGSSYASFEFNQDYNYIAVENDPLGESDNPVRFGKYTMPAKDVIDMINLGVLKIEADNNEDINLSFSPADEHGKEMRFTASKAERMREYARTDLFCRTWKVIKSTETSWIGGLFFISNAGTYFFTTPDGESNSMSQWRWYNDKTEEFEYTHYNWRYYGRAKIMELTRNYLKFFDPGFVNIIPGYSNADLDIYCELEPVNN
jgi:hypothetical protein